ncbi:hypothetical protein QBC44DRAFT_375056 [Cladorrhinum sp. PSN332]|nr:hypothetical protein QBC44DRAFT_375056 [Cladorrhinum sp. PSN332]
MGIPLGPDTFLRNHLQNLWEEAVGRDASRRIHFRDFRRKGDDQLASAAEFRASCEALLSELFDAASRPDQHFSQMDELFAPFLEICLGGPSIITRSKADAIDRAIALLERLPPTPLRFDLSCQRSWDSDGIRKLRSYLNRGTGMQQKSDSSSSFAWERLIAVTKLSTPTLRLALLLTDSSEPYRDVWFRVQEFLDFVSALIDLTCLPSDEIPSASRRSDPIRSDIVQAYLWSTWTRCSLLLYWSILGNYLRYGYDDQLTDLTVLRGNRLLHSQALAGTRHGCDGESVPYMCSWAFRLLKTDRAALPLDFRHFHRRYGGLHGGKRQRCLWESKQPCAGGHPLECGRFQDTRLVAEEQSVHACGRRRKDCKMVVGKMDSYISIKGPVAVSTRPAKRGAITYVKASESTMAISHVWSHGHGGRPETGMNSCLHKRLSRIAKRHGCDSYWIDTLCIPDEHQLRTEAIGYINWIFRTSKAVLILDRDLMELDVSKQTVKVLESFLVTFLVCDWNVRAWTMLEAMKGCHNLIVLCKDEVSLSLRDCLASLHQHGRVDLVCFILTVRHLIPKPTGACSRGSNRISLETAASMLGHRHATREGDDIVIWSLISGMGVLFYNAKDMWQSRIGPGRSVRSAFLMSTAPRLSNIKGLSWAPATPYIRHSLDGDGQSLPSYLGYEGAGSERLEITTRGLQGLWMVYMVDPADDWRYRECSGTCYPQYDALNECWIRAVDLLREHAEVALLQPKRELGAQPYDLSSGNAEIHGQLFAICVSDGGDIWYWKGTETWPAKLDTPPLKMDEILIG